MPRGSPTAPITVRADKDLVSGIDALAAAMDRSRNYVVVEALAQYVEANAWQVERIEAGLAAAAEGCVRPAAEVFSTIASRHGWSR